MTYDKEKVFPLILENIENGLSLRKTLLLEGMPSRTTFFEWISNNKELANQYARACEYRADLIFDEIITIADNTQEGVVIKETENGIEKTKADMIAHRRLQVDARKWALSKMNPKKYGDKLETENNHTGEITITRHVKK